MYPVSLESHKRDVFDTRLAQNLGVGSTYTYDALARPTEVSHDDGQSIHYGYDPAGNRIGMRTEINDVVQSYVTYEHDDLNRITDVFDHDSAQVPANPDDWFKDGTVVPTQMQYNPLGQMTSISRPNDVDTNYVYGNAGIIDPVTGFGQNPFQVYSIVHEDTETTPVTLAQYDYSYDAVGNRTGMDITASDGSQTNITYEYDRANRLIEESYLLIGGATSDTQYSYDRAGNRTQMRNSAGDITRYSYNANDELTRVDMPDYYFEDYTYDSKGNLISTSFWRDGITPVQLSDPTLYEYNARNLLSRIELPTTQRIDYEYDYRGNRVRQEQVGSQDPILYLWDEFSRFGDVILETGVEFSTGDLYHKMNYTIAGGQLISQTDDTDLTRYFLSDAQGTTRVMTDEMGAISSEYDYDAFGNLDESIDPLSAETDYLYAGQQFDGYSELYSMRARYYDPTQGRFTTRDTYAYNYQNPFELNRYTYGANNPATFTDPSGNSVLGDFVANLTPSEAVILSGTLAISGLLLVRAFYIVGQLLTNANISIPGLPELAPETSGGGGSDGTAGGSGGTAGGNLGGLVAGGVLAGLVASSLSKISDIPIPLTRDLPRTNTGGCAEHANPSAAATIYGIVAGTIFQLVKSAARAAGAMRRDWQSPNMVIAFSRVMNVSGQCVGVASASWLPERLRLGDDRNGYTNQVEWLDIVQEVFDSSPEVDFNIPLEYNSQANMRIDSGHAETNLYQQVHNNPNLVDTSLIAMGSSKEPCAGNFSAGSADCNLFFSDKNVIIGWGITPPYGWYYNGRRFP